MISMLACNCSAQDSNAQSAPASPPATNVVPAPIFQETTTPTAAPATLPPNISPTSPLAQVVRLTQADVDQEIIMLYVTNSSRTFNLDSDKIIYLSDLGVPTGLVTAMMQRDQFLQEQFAAAQAAQQVQQSQPATTETAPESAATNTAEVDVQPPPPVTANYFNETLSPYGSWVIVNGYGRCWRPTAVVYNPNWQPYCDHGHWVYTDCGWYWSSDYAWGATFHYGRWFRNASVGWCWCPDSVWAPSWVTWRYSNNYCGWAPLPPHTYCQTGVGIVYQGSSVSVGFSFGLGASCFTFVPTQYFCNSHPRNYCAPQSQVAQIYKNTAAINNMNVHGTGQHQVIANHGIPMQSIAAVTQTPIQAVPVQNADNSFTQGHHGYTPDHTGHLPGANHPTMTSNPSMPGHQPGPTVQNQNTTAQNPPHSLIITGNGYHQNVTAPPGQTRYPQPMLNHPQQNQTSQFNHGPTDPQRGNNQVATVPQRPVVNFQSPAPHYNYNPQPPQGAVGISPRYPEPRQIVIVPGRTVVPPANYSTPRQAQSQPYNYSPSHNGPQQNFSPPSINTRQTAAPNFGGTRSPQAQTSFRGGNQNWAMH